MPTIQWDPDFCERQYNMRLSVKTYLEDFARWEKNSFLAIQKFPCHLDLQYGVKKTESFDFFPARNKGSGKKPLIIFVHGGYWRSLDKSLYRFVANEIPDAGCHLALINYSLCPAVDIPTIVMEQLNAIRYFYLEGKQFDVDPEQIYLVGHSAGGHLVTQAMCAIFNAYDSRLPNDIIKGAMSISGLYDLEPLSHAPFVQNDLRLSPQTVEKVSTAYLPPNPHSQLITAVGSLESEEFIRQNELIGQRWKKHLIANISMPGKHHFNNVDDLMQTSKPLTRALLKMILG